MGPIPQAADSGRGQDQGQVAQRQVAAPILEAFKDGEVHGSHRQKMASLPRGVRRALRRYLHRGAAAAGRALRKIGTFLEVFSGVCGLSRAMRRRGLDTVSIDFLTDPNHDMLKLCNQKKLLRLIRNNRLSSVWLCTLFHSLTRARHSRPGSGWLEPLCSSACPDGLLN